MSCAQQEQCTDAPCVAIGANSRWPNAHMELSYSRTQPVVSRYMAGPPSRPLRRRGRRAFGTAARPPCSTAERRVYSIAGQHGCSTRTECAKQQALPRRWCGRRKAWRALRRGQQTGEREHVVTVGADKALKRVFDSDIAHDILQTVARRLSGKRRACIS
jgi:hypothetical protein